MGLELGVNQIGGECIQWDDNIGWGSLIPKKKKCVWCVIATDLTIGWTVGYQFVSGECLGSLVCSINIYLDANANEAFISY